MKIDHQSLMLAEILKFSNLRPINLILDEYSLTHKGFTYRVHCKRDESTFEEAVKYCERNCYKKRVKSQRGIFGDNILVTTFETPKSLSLII